MKLTTMALAGVLSLALIGAVGIEVASAGWLSDLLHNIKNNHENSVPEPSSLYALGSALALLGGAGWIMRRK